MSTSSAASPFATTLHQCYAESNQMPREHTGLTAQTITMTTWPNVQKLEVSSHQEQGWGGDGKRIFGIGTCSGNS